MVREDLARACGCSRRTKRFFADREALKAYQRTRHTLRRELGVDPHPTPYQR
ncbi:hypothetical protein HC031_19855 [Planosporangium thailandense]|uniref:Bacterial transcriptional activator domain-containing protein n=1 Tax=Planosporangium thailandense TaxID=765197 RepID=A0ABX0Y0S6_9ACTN|nr:hypothetical protein [Planosporangium thailandense]